MLVNLHKEIKSTLIFFVTFLELQKFPQKSKGT